MQVADGRWSDFVTPPIPFWTGTTSGVSFPVRIRLSAVRDLRRIPPPDRTGIIHAIDILGVYPLVGSVLKGGLRGLRRIRVGRYRVLYEVQDDELIVLVIRVSHRKDAYRPR